MSSNIFNAISGAHPPVPDLQVTHPCPTTGIDPNYKGPIPTNKFYANLFLSDQTFPVFTQPYVVVWSKGGGGTKSWGMSISHCEASQLAFGDNDGTGVKYYLNPAAIQMIVPSAVELGSSTVLTTDSPTAFSVNCNLTPAPDQAPVMTMPLVLGMGFVTCNYNKATPLIQSNVFYQSFTLKQVLANGIAKYSIVLNDGRNWLMYVIGSGANTFTQVDNANIKGPSGFSGCVQIAKNMQGQSGEVLYDKAAGTYALSAATSGTTTGSSGTYAIGYTNVKTAGNSVPLLIFALPHHVATFDSKTKAAVTALQLRSPTKSTMTGLLTDSLVMVEPSLPTGIGFAPWTPSSGSVTTLSQTAVNAINSVATSEINQDMVTICNGPSMYFSGKKLAMFAQICYVLNDLCGNKQLAQSGLANLEKAYAVFVNNQQQTPLAYDPTWKGVVSTAGLKDPNADFGNTYYNDHHFHSGYFVYAAAIIAYLDPNWLKQGSNRDWVNSLIRDFANPYAQGTWMPFHRMFDWYHGHSWAHGLFASGDGKDQESSSEDTLASYGMKMWGRVTGQTDMEARSNVMLAIQARTIPMNYLMTSDNTIQPPQFVPNKATGILFENKCDHATYFGLNPEYICGIHMIPLIPCSPFTRSAKYVQEEWNTYFANGAADKIVGGWRGLVYANYAIINPKAAWSFFSQPNFDRSFLDDGASQTWYLAFCAGLGGA